MYNDVFLHIQVTRCILPYNGFLDQNMEHMLRRKNIESPN